VEGRKGKEKDSVGRRVAMGKMEHHQGGDTEEDQQAQMMVYWETTGKICPSSRRPKRRDAGRRNATHQT
jgi:hypothetical protein